MNTSSSPTIAYIAWGISLLLIGGIIYFSLIGLHAQKTTTVDKRLSSAVNALTHRNLNNGYFTYDYNLKTNQYTPASGHGGETIERSVLYTLGNLLRTSGSTNYRSVLEDAVSKSLDRSGYYTTKSGIRLRPLLPNSGTGELALFYAGASALKNADSFWWKENGTKLHEILNLILWLQKSTGAFAISIPPSGFNDAQKETGPEDPHYTGEALIALAYALDTEEDTAMKDKIKGALTKGYEFINKTYTTGDTQGVYLMLMTATRILAASPSLDTADKKFFTDIALAYHDKAYPILAAADIKNNSCFRTDGVGEYILFAKNLRSVSKERKFRDQDLERNLQFLVTPDMKIVVNASTTKPVPLQGSLSLVGGFVDNLENYSTRLDYTVHCVEALHAQLEDFVSTSI